LNRRQVVSPLIAKRVAAITTARRSEERTMNDNLPIGAHLVTPRKWYEHHGVYVGNGRVVHYSGFCHGYHAGPVEEVSLADFERGQGFRVRAHAHTIFSSEQIAARARSRVGESGYRLFANNCEHFCEWCVTGRSRSRQVERLLFLPRIIARRVVREIAAFVAGMTAARQPI
jgi:hypothetical protein